MVKSLLCGSVSSPNKSRRLCALVGYNPSFPCFLCTFSCSHFDNVLVRYRYRSSIRPRLFSIAIANRDIDSDPERATITGCGSAALCPSWIKISSFVFLHRAPINATGKFGTILGISVMGCWRPRVSFFTRWVTYRSSSLMSMRASLL
ncbi:MAG: hypothetical protein BECKG1743E_GA0114224_105792 [Candidatus Kentron sp. G]|nr:MAG: hypothetical protein BECKG1743E_GA0114224_105792 [Candidatus Kentron sp. G]